MPVPDSCLHIRFILRRVVAPTVALAMGLCANASAALDISTIETAAGPWEIALLNTERRCGMQLRTEKVQAGDRMIGMTAGCRRALPILMDVGGWSVKGAQTLEFEDRAGKLVLTFNATEEDKLVAKGPEGETYELIATGRQRYAQVTPAPTPGTQAQAQPAPAGGPARPSATPGIRPVPVGKPQAGQPAQPAPNQPADQQAGQGGPTSPPQAFAGRTSDISGRYIIMRENGKDIGCMLTLNDQARGPGGFKAQLAPACRDNGIVVFDPLGWSLGAGKLALTARKGHKANFIYHQDGSWWKDPKEGGKPLGIRKMM